MKPTHIIYTDNNGFEHRHTWTEHGERVARVISALNEPSREELLGVIEIQRSIIRDLVNCPDLNLDELEPETEKVLTRARAAISTD